jgi:hypothetical protein
MAKNLNDAWMECIETSRLIAENYHDCLRRLAKMLGKAHLKEFDSMYGEIEKDLEMSMPWCTSVIVIGRRSTLDAEGLLRTRELSASTGQAIRVITYDTVLDWVGEMSEDSHWNTWGPFGQNWYW